MKVPSPFRLTVPLVGSESMAKERLPPDVVASFTATSATSWESSLVLNTSSLPTKSATGLTCTLVAAEATDVSPLDDSIDVAVQLFRNGQWMSIVMVRHLDAFVVHGGETVEGMRILLKQENGAAVLNGRKLVVTFRW